ncbi:MAG: hypothetical protein RQ735_04590 [Flavobacteriaceae bacterium]|nr:hypothetical protein [Flavobacteriaceae bacterium]
MKKLLVLLLVYFCNSGFYYTTAKTSLANLEGLYTNVENLIEAGDLALKEKEWDKAIGIFEKLLGYYPNEADFWYKYGSALGMKSLSVSKWESISYLSDVKSAFEKALRLDPFHLGAYWALISYHCEVPGILGGSKKKAYHYANALRQISTRDGDLALAFLAKHEGNDAEVLIQNMSDKHQRTDYEEELRNIFAKITYRKQLTFEAFVRQTQAYRPEWIQEKTNQ